MSSSPPVLKKLERDGYCRLCDNVMSRNEDDVISWYSTRNRGQNIHICIPCIGKLHRMTEAM